VEVVASLSQGRTAAAQCGFFTHESVPVIFEPPCISLEVSASSFFARSGSRAYSDVNLITQTIIYVLINVEIIW